MPGQRGKRPSLTPLGYTNFIKAIFRPIKRLKPSNFYLVLSRENSAVAITIFCIFFPLWQSNAVLMMFQTIYGNLRTPQELDFRSITTSKNNLSEIHISLPTL